VRIAWRLSRSNTHDWSFDLECPPVRFWNEWNDPGWNYEWREPFQSMQGYRTEVGPDGEPYTVKWRSLSYPTNGAGVLTMTTFYAVDGVHPETVTPS
jgi:hypothetical protein